MEESKPTRRGDVARRHRAAEIARREQEARRELLLISGPTRLALLRLLSVEEWELLLAGGPVVAAGEIGKRAADRMVAGATAWRYELAPFAGRRGVWRERICPGEMDQRTAGGVA